MITQSELKEILHYCPETGVFTWRISLSRIRIGAIAGTKNHHGFIFIQVSGKKYSAAILAWLYSYGERPKDFINHINNIKDDNRLCNLRESTRQQSCFTSAKARNRTSKMKGVFFSTFKNKWESQARLNYKCINLGAFDTQEEAFKAYDSFAKSNHGEFYRKN